MRGSVWKRCPCGTTGLPARGAKPAVPACKKKHGSWYWRADAKRGAVERKQPGKGGYVTREAATEALNEHLKSVQDGTWTDDKNMTVETYLNDVWLPGRKERVEAGTLGLKTYVNDESSCRTFIIPAIGQHRLRELRHKHVEDMIRNGRTPEPPMVPADRDRPRVKCTAPAEETKTGEPCKKWANIGYDRCYRHGGGKAGPRRGQIGRIVEVRKAGTLAGHRRILRNALNAAKRRDLISANPAEGLIESMPKDGKPDTKVWEPEQVAIFLLDLELGVLNAEPNSPEWLEAVQDDAMYEVATLAGLRRGELAGLPWDGRQFTGGEGLPGVDLAGPGSNRGINIGPQCNSLAGLHDCYACKGAHRGYRLKPGPKTNAGWRWAPLVEGTTQKLLVHRAAQAEDREKWQDAYVDHGLVFCRPDGLPLDPKTITDRFQERAERLGLPVIRLHDTRHGATSLLLAAGVPIETVMLIIGHANVSTVREIYNHIQKTPASEGMAAAVALVRGDRRAQSVHRSGPAEEQIKA